MEAQHQHQVQHNVAHRRGDKEVERPLEITHGTEHAGAHVVHHVGDHAQEVDSQVQLRAGEGVLSGAQGLQGPGCEQKARHREERADDQGEEHGGVDALVEVLPAPCTVVLGDGHHRAAGQACEDAHCQVDQRTCGAHSGQGYLAHKAAHHQGVYRVIELLKKGTEPEREEKGQQMLPDHALGNIAGGTHQSHENTS